MNGSEVTQKDIFRLSAVLYAETHETFSAADIQSDIIRCIIANGNIISAGTNWIFDFE